MPHHRARPSTTLCSDTAAADRQQDLASTDELKVYKDEGDENEQTAFENLSEDKLGLVHETEEANTRQVGSNQQCNYSEDDASSCSASNKEYLSGDHLPLVSSLLSPPVQIHAADNTNSVKSILGAGNSALSFYMYGCSDGFGPPPPAHMGISSLYADPKTGLPIYSFNNSATSSLCNAIYAPDLRRFRDRSNGDVIRHDVISESTTSRHLHRRPYIKKPLNAFMLFMKEMRQNVIDECTLKESAAINQILGRKWHALERSEQAKYYDLARKEKQLHMQLYPGWSARDNYATRSKKKKTKQVTDELCQPDNKCTAATRLEFKTSPDCQCCSQYGVDQQHRWCKTCRLDYDSINENRLSSEGMAAIKPKPQFGINQITLQEHSMQGSTKVELSAHSEDG